MYRVACVCSALTACGSMTAKSTWTFARTLQVLPFDAWSEEMTIRSSISSSRESLAVPPEHWSGDERLRQRRDEPEKIKGSRLKKRTRKCAPANSRAYPASYTGEEPRATPCKQQRSAALAWSWAETVPIGSSRCLVRLGHTNTAKDERNACAAVCTLGRSETPSAAMMRVRVPTPTLVSTGSRMRCQRQHCEQSEISD